MGPVQLLVIGFEAPEFKGAIRDELERLREHDVVRVIDLLVVRKDEDGNVERLRHSDLSEEEQEELGAVVGALVGYGAAGEEGAEEGAELGAAMAAEGSDEADTWFVDDAIPNNSAAAIALLEHRWAIPLREAIREAGGFHLADAWIHASDLVAVGLLAREEAEAH
jgi:uncharacterized membrane protein